MLDDKNIRESIISKIDENQIPDLSQAIKQQYLKQKSHKATPWYKKPLFYGVGTPILACGIIACIVIPNAIANHKTSGEPPIINVGKRQEEIAFGIFSIRSGAIRASASSSQFDENIFMTPVPDASPLSMVISPVRYQLR